MSVARRMDEPDVVNIYNGITLSHSKEWNNAICSNMDGPGEYHTEWSKSDGEGEILHDIHYMWNLKRNDTRTYNTETQKLGKQTYDCGEGGIARDFRKIKNTLLYFKWKTNNDLLYRTGNSALVLSQPGWERSLGENVVPSLFPWTPTTLLISYTPKQNKKFKV